jgi:hypothetical protein
MSADRYVRFWSPDARGLPDPTEGLPGTDARVPGIGCALYLKAI